MNYVILDLEWDSTFFVKQKRFINQILQIGAVKLDQNFQIIDTFEITVKSAISKRVTGRFARLTGITSDVMRTGVPFAQAVEKYNAWVGDDTVTMTWSNSDLYTILENEENLLDGVKFKIEKYMDLQKFIQNEMKLKGYEDKNQVSLALAAEFLDVKTDDIDFHTAKDDSLVAAYLLKKCYNAERFVPLIKDTANPEFFKKLRFKSYAISNLKDENVDKEYLEFSCPKCKQKAKKVTKWKYSNRWFSANFICDCGEKFNGRVTFKKTYDDLIVRQKICEFKEKKKENKEVTV
ncbi:MAG: exonuclease domain-containing protein [Ruminococcaceae bacterium]|nr:exonuclease domain-containing protein [Oscillospiraceae bacterium]